MATLALYLLRSTSQRRWVGVALGVCLLDQAAKALVSRHYVAEQHYYDRFSLLGGWLQICHEQNHALGFGGSSSHLLVITGICAIALSVLYWRLARTGYRMPLLTELGCALILGALLGALLDRIRLGLVVDFVEFGRAGNFTYNIGDLSAFAGAVLLALRGTQFIASQRPRRAVRPSEEPKGSSSPPYRAAAEASPVRVVRRRAAQRAQWLWMPAMLAAAAALLRLFWWYGGNEESFMLPLQRAAYHGDTRSLSRLLDAGFDINQRDQYGHTPLHYAAIGGSTHAVEMLVSRGAEVNAGLRRHGDKTPLDFAAAFGHAGLVEFLLAHGAHLSHSSLYSALMSRRPEIVGLVLRHGADVKGVRGAEPPLMLAVSVGCNLHIVRLLLAAGADVSARNERGQTALHCAAVHGHAEMARALLCAGADVNAKDDQGQTPLHVIGGLSPAFGWPSGTDVAAVLIAHGADANARPADGRTPLMRAVLKRDPDQVKLLIAAGAHVNARDPKGWTALHYAAAKGRAQLVEPLLDAGAMVNPKNADGATPLDLAKDQGVVELLRRRGRTGRGV
jgi:ankyrin repeat protein/lipoprotein signal peptidase